MKIIRKIGDGLFRFTDSFFQGSNCGSTENPDKIIPADQVNCMVWELNQGVEDIVLKDLSVSINLLVPAFLRKPAAQFYKKVCMYFLVDAAIEEESLDPTNISASSLTFPPLQEGKILTLFSDTKKIVSANVLSLRDWLKFKLQKVSSFLRLLQPEKPYYLLGDFAPSRYDNYCDKSNFRKTYIFHLRN
jgi:hypothetical protein